LFNYCNIVQYCYNTDFFTNIVSDKESGAAAVVARATSLARILLLCSDEESKFRQNAGQSDLRADTVGQERGGTRKVGERE